MNANIVKKLSYIGALFTLVVISAGAWVRLTDAGLGCPDWPGCYGILSTPDTEKELYQGKKQTVIGRPHIATLMVQKGYVKSFQEAFNRYLGEGKCCYSPGKPYSVEETLLNIKNAGGKAFAAHPHLIRSKKQLNALLELDFDGLECFYSKIPAFQEKPFLRLADRKGLLVSGGSDFHGEIKPYIDLGCSWVDKKTAEAIFRNYS